MAGGRHAEDIAAKPEVLKDWLGSLAEFKARAVLVLGPDPNVADAANDSRSVVSVYPGEFRGAAASLARSDAFGTAWRRGGGSLVAWKNFSGGSGADERWIGEWMNVGALSMVRAEIPMPFQHGFECFVFCQRQLANKAEAASVAWAALSVWPLIKEEILAGYFDISARERQVLAVIAEGLTTRDAAKRIGCTERTINFHLTNLMAKLKADNRPAAIQRACALGIL
jgi:LuxR family transcriptional regulator, quorum-sensing system regulator SolR